MRFSKEKLKELKNHIRFEMVKNPNVSILELQIILRDTYHHTFDKNFIGKLKRKVHKERSVRYNFSLLYEELAKLEDLIRYGRQQLVDIVFNDAGKYKPHEIIMAFRTIVWGEMTLFDAMLNAGVFNRPSPKEKEKPLSPEQQALLEKALNYATGRAEESRQNNQNDERDNIHTS